MANALPFLSAHIISELRKLDGRAKVSFPYADEAYKRTERVLKVSKGTAANPKWQLDFLTADPEHPTAKLVTQVKLGEDNQEAEVYRVYEEITGLPLRTLEVYGNGAYKETTRQRVPAATLPEPAEGEGGATMADQVTQANALYADRVTVRLVDENGTELTGGVILTTEDLDAETGVPIYTDRFIAEKGYTLPAVKTGGKLFVNGVQVYVDVKQPNTNHVGYSNTSYSPKRWPIDARKINMEGSEKVIVEIEYCRRPTSSARDVPHAQEAPALFDYDQTSLYLPNDYTGKFKPPWPIGADQPLGYSFIGHRISDQPAREYKTYSVGPTEALPKVFVVYTPGAGSILFRGLIPQNCIHPPLHFYETLPNGAGYALIEDLPSSTPASYDPNAIYCIAASEVCWNGEIYVQTVVMWSERRRLSEFPDPRVEGYYPAVRNFRATPLVELDPILQAKKVLVKTIAPQTVVLTLQASPLADFFTLATHGLKSGDPVSFSTSVTLPSPLVAGQIYFVNVLTDDTFAISLERGATALNLTTTGSGTLKMSGGTTGGTGSETVEVKLYGRVNLSDPGVSTMNKVIAAPTITATTGNSLSESAWLNIREMLLEQPLLTDSVQLFEPSTPDTGALQITGTPTNGQLLKLGLTGGDVRIYQFRTALTDDAVMSIALKTATISLVANGSDTYTSVAHGLANGNGIKFSTTGVMPAGLTAGTVYFVINTAADTFKVSATSGGAAVNITTDGTGTLTITYCGGGYVSAPTLSVASGVGHTATATATISGGAITAVTVTAPGDGYLAAPTVTPSGGSGSGGAFVVTLGQLNQIKISATRKFMALAIAQAIRGENTGSTVGASTVAHANLTAKRAAGDLTTVLFTSTDPTVVGGTYLFDLYESDGSTLITSSVWFTKTAFETGASGALLATIPAGLMVAHRKGAADFSINTCLADATNDNDRKAVASLPAALVFRTDWMPIPAGKEIEILYAIGGSAIIVSYEGATDTAPPARTSLSLTVTNGSATIGAVSSSYIGQSVFIAGDTVENEIVTTTTLRRAYAGTTGTKTADVIPITAHTLAPGGDNRLRIARIGIPAVTYIRLKFQQTQASITDRFGSVSFRPAYANAQWIVTPDDDDS